MATTPKSRATNSKTANRSRSASTARTASNARRRPAAAKTLPTPEPSTASKLRVPLLADGAAIAGIAGGIVLGAKARPRRRSVPSLPSLPSMNGLDLKKVDMKKTRKQVGRASKEFGAFTRELRKAGEQAERIGNALD